MTARCVVMMLVTVIEIAAADAVAQTGVWTQRHPVTSPTPRSWPSMAFDERRSRVVLFGGSDSLSPGMVLNDTWEWDGANWVQIFSSTVPPARYAHRVVYDSARDRVLLFGGSVDGNQQAFGDTWEWDGSNWTQLTPAASPPSRWNHAMCYDPVRQRVVLFGGLDETKQRLADTWEWDGTNWSSITTAVAPPPRYDHGLAPDTTPGRLVLFGGVATGVFLGDTWTWAGTNWVQRLPATSPPATQCRSLAFSPTAGATVMFGGKRAGAVYTDDTWHWDGSTWSLSQVGLRPASRRGASMVFDGARGTVLLFGGITPSTVFSDTWEYVAGPPGAFVPFGAGCTGTAGVPGLWRSVKLTHLRSAKLTHLGPRAFLTSGQ